MAGSNRLILQRLYRDGIAVNWAERGRSGPIFDYKVPPAPERSEITSTPSRPG